MSGFLFKKRVRLAGKLLWAILLIKHGFEEKYLLNPAFYF